MKETEMKVINERDGICLLNYSIVDKYSISESENLEEEIVYGNPALKNIYPTLNFKRTNANTVILNNETNPPYIIITKNLINYLLKIKKGTSYYKIIENISNVINQTEDESFIYILNKESHLDLLSEVSKLEKRTNLIFTKEQNDIKHYTYVPEMKLYINKGKSVINENNYKGYEKMLTSEVNDDKILAVKVLESVDFNKSCPFFMYLCCKYINVIKKDLISKRLQKIFDVIKFKYNDMINAKEYYIRYMIKTDKPDLDLINRLSLEI